MVNKIRKKIISKLPYFQYGSIIFGIGILIALLGSFLDLSPENVKIIIVTEFVLGIIIGLINITEKETKKYLIASIALIVLIAPIITVYVINSNAVNMSIVQVLLYYIFESQKIYDVTMRFIMAFLALLIGSTAVVSFKAFFETAKNEN